jgi:hypothetical protein
LVDSGQPVIGGHELSKLRTDRLHGRFGAGGRPPDLVDIGDELAEARGVEHPLVDSGWGVIVSDAHDGFLLSGGQEPTIDSFYALFPGEVGCAATLAR